MRDEKGVDFLHNSFLARALALAPAGLGKKSLFGQG